MPRLTCPCALVGLFACGLAVEAQPPSAPIGKVPLESYSCTITEKKFETDAQGRIQQGEVTEKRVILRGAAYRVDLSVNGRLVETVFNPGDGSGTEFRYRASQKRAELSHSSLRFLYASQLPQRWIRNGQGDPKAVLPPSGHYFIAHTIEPAAQQKLLTQNLIRRGIPAVLKQLGETTIDGWRCKRFLLHIPTGGPTSPQAKQIRTLGGETVYCVSIKTGVLLRSRDRRIIVAATRKQPQRVQEKHVEVRNLRLNPPVEASTFSPPRGTTYYLWDAYNNVNVPPGEKVILAPGRGLTFPGDPGIDRPPTKLDRERQ